MTTLRAGWATDVGRVRKVNEDSYLAEDDFFVVADGMGGHRGGEVASLTAVEAMRASFTERTLAGLVAAVEQANQAVWDRAAGDPAVRGMGTTVTAVALVQQDGEDHLVVAHVGDSRAYLLRQQELSQLSEDHSLVGELVREGELTLEEAAVHPQRSVVTRALGIVSDIDVDTIPLVPVRGDRILLCSDGLTNEVYDDDIATILRTVTEPGEAAEELVRLARDNGGRDNITAIVVDVVDDGDRAVVASAALRNEPSPPPRDPEVVRTDGRDTTTAVPITDGRVEGGLRTIRQRRITWRVVVFMVALLGVVGAAGYGLYVTGRQAYYVGFAGDEVVIFKGRPGGVLWLDPTLEQHTNLTRAAVPPARVDDVEGGKEFGSLAAAERYVFNLADETAGATTTTVPPPPPGPSASAPPAAGAPITPTAPATSAP